jgi:hypothetical protein
MGEDVMESSEIMGSFFCSAPVSDQSDQQALSLERAAPAVTTFSMVQNGQIGASGVQDSGHVIQVALYLLELL